MSGKVYAYIAFSCLNALTAFFVSWLMHIRIKSFAIVAVINEWDLDEKARACRNAGLMYLGLAVGLFLRFAYKQRRNRAVELAGYEAEAVNMQERVPLLYSTALELNKSTPQGGVVRFTSGYGSGISVSQYEGGCEGSRESPSEEEGKTITSAHLEL
ncbi:hypothetical protein TraAM80_01104 [Trypanosoma rangeli]|uniref:Uncharacterized protein n=1 Tax=Trypanosoma rangeli TaxID=5698 RepID=A0A422P096_TRYRA|nr:uncharacterized protein TraAM80_01104 [Trypanosoma rangeli]RNF11173.1 hypothetical protein TraAM80_01104 [Trypanosoma rangeli]|eukprot:RNF11173.1 hypothetical protein TraAM80_01104 [Trypanosoma rangeli]